VVEVRFKHKPLTPRPSVGHSSMLSFKWNVIQLKQSGDCRKNPEKSYKNNERNGNKSMEKTKLE
jgi:hypothetical protein